MQDEINEKVIALSIRTTKLTAEMLQKSIRFMLSQIKKQLDKAAPTKRRGAVAIIGCRAPFSFFCLFLADFCYADPADV